MFGSHNLEDVPPATTLPPEQATDFLDNMVLAMKDGNINEWLETVSFDHVQKVAMTVKDVTLMYEVNNFFAPEVVDAITCYHRCMARLEQEGGDIREAVICGPCANRLAAGLMDGHEHMKKNATPTIKALLDYAEEVKKQAILQAPAMLEQMAQTISREMGIPIEDARKQCGLTPDGKALLNQQGKSEEGEEGSEEPKDDKPSTGWTSGLGE